MVNLQTIHFAHANGFPAKTYTKLFSFLADEFEIGFLDRHGHNPDFPVTQNWKFLQKELKSEIETRYNGPIIGVGHSLGGILHLLVAAENPALYQSIILLDAPIISRSSSLGLKILKKLNLMESRTPSQVTKLRRAVWKDENDAIEHFKKKEKFNAFDKDVLRDYVRYGTEKCDKGIRLLFKPSIEADIYETIPVDLPKLRGKLNIPISYIGGTESREARLANLRFMKKYFSIKYYFLDGTHLFPFENPKKTAETIKKAIKENLV
jgi:surfactin synthase thioesterase subunit